jgi:hypothetical protein
VVSEEANISPDTLNKITEMMVEDAAQAANEELILEYIAMFQQ